MPNHLDDVPSRPSSSVRNFVKSSAFWGQGYFTGIAYGAYSFRELAPNWIDFALLCQRQRPPRLQEGDVFKYIELGSGMGLGLCLLAAAYPEGQFVGIDFHPGHIAHSQWLVQELQLSNVVFHEADFGVLADSDQLIAYAPDQSFHYVVAHGILSWVAESVRQAMISLANRLLKPGGAFYCSYNTFPGWLDRTAFKSLLNLERQRPGVDGLLGSIERTTATLMRLAGGASDTTLTPLSRAFPSINQNLKHIMKQMRTPSYLCGEYGAEHWQPFYVGEIHKLAAANKLDYVASASLPDNYPSFLPADLAFVVEEESDPMIRQALIDLAINQSFRRDLFIKGSIPLSQASQHQLLAGQIFCYVHYLDDVKVSKQEPVSVQTNMGCISIDADLVGQLLARLHSASSLLGEIVQLLDKPLHDILKLMSLLLHEGWIGLHRGSAQSEAAKTCRSVNQKLLELIHAGNNLNFVASPVVGHGGEPISVLDAFTLAGIEQGLDGDVLSMCVWMGLSGSGVDMRNSEGDLINGTEDCLKLIQEHILAFQDSRLPRLNRLGIVES